MKVKNYWTKLITLVIASVVGTINAEAQSNNLSLNVISPWNFIINDASKLETAQVITNAFRLSVFTKTSSCSVLARISNYTAPVGFFPTSNPIAIDFTSTTCPTSKYSNLLTQPVTLSGTNQLLFKQAKIDATYFYYYNLNLEALGYDYIPGNYTWDITFTMTQP